MRRSITIRKPASVSYWPGCGKSSTPSARCTSGIGVMPSARKLPSSRRMICCSSSSVETSEPITVLITSFSVITPTTSEYSLTMTAKSSCAWRNCVSTSASVSRSGTISTFLTSAGSARSEITSPRSTRWNRSVAST